MEEASCPVELIGAAHLTFFCLNDDMYLEERDDASEGLQIEKLLHRLRVSNPRLN